MCFCRPRSFCGCLSFLLCLASISCPAADNAETIVRGVRTKHEDNRAAFPAAGTIRFHCSHGTLGELSNIEALDGVPRAVWTRGVPSRGLYVFDEEKRRYESIYTPEEHLARRKTMSATSLTSDLISDRLLTDGKTTLVDTMFLAANSTTIIHSVHLHAGTREFFRLAAGIPLRLGDMEPPLHDLTRCLTELLDHDTVVLTEVDDRAKLDSTAVIKLDLADKARGFHATFWVDPVHVPYRCSPGSWNWSLTLASPSSVN